MKRGLFVIVFAGLFISMQACHKQSEQKRVKKTIVTVQKAADGTWPEQIRKNDNELQIPPGIPALFRP